MTTTSAVPLDESHGSIVRAEVFAVSHEFRPAVGVSIAWTGRHDYLLVKLTDAAGRVGWGETYLMPGLGQVTCDLARLLIGAPAMQLRAHHRLLASTLASSYAISALLIAIDDLRGHQLGVPVHQLYGGAVRQEVAAYAASAGYISGVEPEESWPAEAQECLSAGFEAIKLRIGRYRLDREIAILTRLRRDNGSDLMLAADGNGGYSFADAMRMGDALADLGFAWFEEPLPQRGYRGYARLAGRLRLPLAGGELVENADTAAHLLDASTFDLVQPDPVICEGLAGLMLIADNAALRGIPVIPHTSGSAIGIVAAIHAVACLPAPAGASPTSLPRVEIGRGRNDFRTRLLTHGPDLDSGTIQVPAGPGLGIVVDEDFVQGNLCYPSITVE